MIGGRPPRSARSARPWAAALALLCAAGRLATADPLLRVRVDSPDPDRTAAELGRSGYDLVPRTAPDAPVELIATADEVAALRAGGVAATVVEVGHPLDKIDPDSPTAGYPTAEEIDARLERFAADFPAITRLVDLTAELGTPATFQGYHLRALELSDHPGTVEDEPAILLLAGLHPREIVNPLLLLDTIDRLTRGYRDDPEISAIIDHNHVWIAPLWNPDGYRYVFRVDNLWRKNRRPFPDGVGVDLNRNFPFGWDSACAGYTDPTSRFYRGPAPASEAETQTLIAFTKAERFAKVLEFHSSGRKVVWGWRCATPLFQDHLALLAGQLAQILGYVTHAPSADSEHFAWQLTRLGTISMLVETASGGWQPPYQDALLEIERVWPGTLWLLEHPMTVSGHVTEAGTGVPLVAEVAVVGLVAEHGERLASEPRFGRYQLELPAGHHWLRYSAPGYRDEVRDVAVTAGPPLRVDVALEPDWAPPGPDAAPDDAGVRAPADAGCGCAGGPRSPGGLTVLLVGLWLVLRREPA